MFDFRPYPKAGKKRTHVRISTSERAKKARRKEACRHHKSNVDARDCEDCDLGQIPHHDW